MQAGKHTYRQSYMQKNIQALSYTGLREKQASMHLDKETYRHTCTQAVTQTILHIGKQRGKQANRHTGRQSTIQAGKQPYRQSGR